MPAQGEAVALRSILLAIHIMFKIMNSFRRILGTMGIRRNKDFVFRELL
jgi:hypothetical protein